MNPRWVSTMIAGVFDPGSITLSSAHAGNSKNALALPAGHMITAAQRRHLLQSERISLRSRKGVLGLAAYRFAKSDTYKFAKSDSRVVSHFLVDRSLDPTAALVVVDTLIVALEIGALRDRVSSLALVVSDDALLPRLAAHGYFAIRQNRRQVWLRKTVGSDPGDSAA